jgi:hypothetical protein
MIKNLASAALCAAACTLAACAGEGPAPDTSTAWFAVLQRDIFDQNCTSGPCHNPQAVAGGLVLTTGFAYQDLVGVEPANPTALSQDLLRVAPFDPDASFLLRKLQAPGPGEGSRMPQGAAPLSQSDIQFIRDWILEGAPGPETPGVPTAPTATPTATEIPPAATASPTATAPASATPADPMPTSPTTPAANTPTPAASTPTETPSPTAPPSVTLEQVQAAVFSPSCAVQFCHSGDFPAAGLNLEEDRSFGELVGVVPTTPAAAGLLLVEPGNPEDSFLYIKIVGPRFPAEGSRMPLLGEPLGEEQIQLVRDWIAGLEP